MLANIALVALLVSTIVLNFEELLSVFGTGAILAVLLFIVGAFVIGYLLGITGRGTREELALGTAQRNIAAGTVVATQSLGHPDTIVMVVVTSIVTMAILFPTAAALRRLVERKAGGAQLAETHTAG
jgi:BASS family bile acid:Na+ symporter